MVVSSFGKLHTLADQQRQSLPNITSYDIQASAATYAEMYSTQPQVRTVVDFLSRNIAQLGLHAFRRISDLDRERLADYQLLKWLKDPNAGTCRYRLIENLVHDLGIYYNAYWLKVRKSGGDIGLVRLPPEGMAVTGWLIPRGFIWTLPNGQTMPLDPSEIVYFNGYDPNNPLMGLSPLETLRRILEEESAANAYRCAFWTNSARLEGVISRPATAPKWTPEQKTSFREQWQSRFAGPANAGQTAVLEDGMTFQATSYSARDSQYADARKLTREEVAAAYHVPQPMVGILDHATFSNIKEQHKQLYQDTLGPWLVWIQEELERQLLIDCKDQTNVYLEFNIAEKLKGSFEEQAASLQTLVGRPVMTANEGRARLNLSMIKDDPTADQLAMPLNLSTGAATEPADPTVPTDQEVVGFAAPVIRAHFDRQRARLDKVSPDERVAAFDSARWNRELAQALEPIYRASRWSEADAVRASAARAEAINTDTLQLLAAGEEPFSAARQANLYA